jgi:NAD(P)H-flavin reductase
MKPAAQRSLFLPRFARVEAREEMTPREVLLRVRLEDGSALGYTPGQFIQLSIFRVGEAPISIASSPTRGPSFELGVRAVGNVTDAIHRLKPGDLFGVRGPFGNGFPLADLARRDIVFVAGGCGFYPLRSAVQYAADRPEEFGRLILLYGCREPAELLFPEEIARWKEGRLMEVFQSVDRVPPGTPWTGSVGVITGLFSDLRITPERTTAIIVGPPVMYRFVIAECLKKGIAEEQILVSLERRMECGVGLCGHCQMENILVCREGPVFSCARLGGLHEAL